MTTFDRSFDILIGHEGGYVNNPADPGGETNFGISKAAHPNEDIRNMTLDRAKSIYRRDYWDKISGDKLPPKIAFLTFDAAVNSGVAQAAKWLQTTVGAVPDGFIGPKTLAKFAITNTAEAARDMLQLRLAFMEQLPTYPVFGRGWRRRIITLAMQSASF